MPSIDSKALNTFDALFQDVRSALRALLKQSGATALSIASMIMGIAVTTVGFSMIDTGIFRPAAVADPGSLFEVTSIGDDGRRITYTWEDFEKISEALAGRAAVAAFERGGDLLVVNDEPTRLMTERVSENFFAVLGIPAALGSVATGQIEGRPQVVLSHRCWQKRFGGDPKIVGTSLPLNRGAVIVAGVMPKGFSGSERFIDIDIWRRIEAPQLNRSDRQRRSQGGCTLFLRAAEGTTRSELEGRIDAVLRQECGYKPAPVGTRATRLKSKYALTWKQKSIAAGMMIPLLGLLLAVSCANVAQLRLIQVEERRREFAVRLAMGAAPIRVARLLALETLIIGAVGATLGVLIATKLLSILRSIISTLYPIVDFPVELDLRVLTFALFVTFLAVTGSSVAPIRHALTLNLLDLLKQGEGTPRAKSGWKRLFLASQVTAAVVFFGMALQLLQSWSNASDLKPGFDPDKNVAVVRMEGLRGERAIAAAYQLRENFAGRDGVRGATFGRNLPQSFSGGRQPTRLELPGEAPCSIYSDAIAPDYFKTVGITFVSGREFSVSDTDDSTPVAIVSEAIARRLPSDRPAIGQQILIDGTSREIVGICADVTRNLDQPAAPFVYLPYAQSRAGPITLFVETVGPAEPMLSIMQSEIRDLFGGNVIVFEATTFRKHMRDLLFPRRALAIATTTIGGLGLLLTAASLFGAIQHSVSQRTREIGVRMALGAHQKQIRRTVLGESLMLIAPGLGLGLVLLAVASRLLESGFVGVRTADPAAFVISTISAVAIAIVAAWLPALRATRVDPVVALRAE